MMTQLNNNNCLSIVPFVKRKGDFYIGDYVAPLTRFPKYGISIDMLLNRINALALQYGLVVKPKVFRLDAEDLRQIKDSMKGKGGIYIWYSHVNGYFYVGSAKRFFGKNGRLNTYLMPSRIAEGQRYISPDLAEALRRDGTASFSLVIVQEWNTDIEMNMDTLIRQEQFWILLYPTFNRSLKVGSNEGQPMLEADRRILSTLLFSYEVSDGTIIPESKQLHYGKKELARNGFYNIDGDKVNITNFDLSPCVKYGSLFKKRYLFTEVPLSSDDIQSWVAPSEEVPVRVEGDKRTKLVYVYKYVSPSHVYTTADFVESNTVTEVQSKYSFGKTQFQRVRRTGEESKGFRFSNVQLHELTT